VGYFTVASNNPTKYTCIMTMRKQPEGSPEPYLIIRDDIKYP
jgi:hypothetical protein